MGELTLTMMACSNDGCEKNFFTENQETATFCAFCGEKMIYPTYTYHAKPDQVELEEFSTSEDFYENYKE